MGCFTVLKSKKKRNERYSFSLQRTCPQPQEPSPLPEPKTQTRSLKSAPPSFRTRVKQFHQDPKPPSSRTRTLSAPETLDAAEQETLTSNEEDFKAHFPLPLPSPEAVAALKPTSSFKSTNSGPLSVSGPLPLPPSSSLKNFSLEEIAAACFNFSAERCVSEGPSYVVYRGLFEDTKKLEGTIIRLHSFTQSMKEFLNETNVIASLRHPNLCKLVGYHASEHRVLVYERLHHGSLDKILHGGQSIDWNTRMKIALCAAQGLTFLHEEGPFQAMYNEFSSSHVQIDIDYTAKLSGYGYVGNVNTSANTVDLDFELLTPKTNVWSFGVFLVELLTGRRNNDGRYPKEERNLVKWSRPFLTDEWRLSLIMDPNLKGRFPVRAARAVGEVAMKCLQSDTSERPTMRSVVESLRVASDVKYSCWFPLQEPTRRMFRSPSLNGAAPPLKGRGTLPPHGPAGVRASAPSRTCSTLSLKEFQRMEIGC